MNLLLDVLGQNTLVDAYWFELELSIADGKQQRRIEWIN